MDAGEPPTAILRPNILETDLRSEGFRCPGDVVAFGGQSDRAGINDDMVNLEVGGMLPQNMDVALG